jgi:DNA-binding GntR family transcriptional regulator
MKQNVDVSNNLSILRGSSIATIVRDQLEQDIIAGVLSGGTHVSELTVAGQFGVSRGPVREALRSLEGQGILEQRKNCGWFVRSLSPEEIQEIFVFRQILDDGLSSLLIKNVEEENYEPCLLQLGELIDDMDNSIAQGDQGSFALQNQEFHDKLLILSGNARLRQTYRRVMGELASHVTESLKSEGSMLASNEDHKEIIQSLRDRDFSKVNECLKTHNDRTKLRMCSV